MASEPVTSTWSAASWRQLPAAQQPVWPDADGEFSGPLSGFLSGLSHCTTDWLVTVPCDSPRLPLDLVARFAAEMGPSLAAIAVTQEQGARQRQPVFCLLHRSLQGELSNYISGGGRKIDRWLDSVGCANVFFEDAGAFFNANTIEELRQLGAD